VSNVTLFLIEKKWILNILRKNKRKKSCLTCSDRKKTESASMAIIAIFMFENRLYVRECFKKYQKTNINTKE